MKDQEDFYIGWQEKMPASYRDFLKKWLLPIALLLPLLGFTFVLFQHQFSLNQFEFGTIREVTGTYYAQPFPMLIANEGSLPENLSSAVLLVGYGKFGARGIMDNLEKSHGELQGKRIKLSGTLIYGEGQTLMELTQEDQSFKELVSNKQMAPPLTAPTRNTTLTGEIIDPKCYFGVMKPATGKIHKSCAIRCISGGIPPVFRTSNKNSESGYTYYILLGTQGQEINQDLLSYVAEPVSIKGLSTGFFDWKILYINPDQIEHLE